MFGYIVRRLVAAFLVVVLTSMITFAVFFLGPSNPADLICQQGGHCTAEKQQRIEHELGLDQSVVTQYGKFVKGLFVDREIEAGAHLPLRRPLPGHLLQHQARGAQGDDQALPRDHLRSRSAAPSSSSASACTLGVLAARWRGTVDRQVPGDRQPVALRGPVLRGLPDRVDLSGQRVGHIQGRQRLQPPDRGSGQVVRSPVAALARARLASCAEYARFTRGSMAEVLGEDYVRTATAKGVSSNKVVFGHALRAAIVPVITIFGLDFATLLAGTIFTEYIFAHRRHRQLGHRRPVADRLPDHLRDRLVHAVLVVLSNLIVDIVYSFIDPRVRLA